LDEWMGGYFLDGWINEWINGWMDGWTWREGHNLINYMTLILGHSSDVLLYSKKAFHTYNIHLIYKHRFHL